MGLRLGLNHKIFIAFVLTALSIIGFLTYDVQSDWSFIIQYRGTKILAMVTVAIAIAVATLIFQTITNSKILTPSLMGFDALYLLINAVVLLLVSKANIQVDGSSRFIIDIALMVVVSVFLFKLVFLESNNSLHLLVLLGMLAGLLFKELGNLALRVIDPTEFSIQTSMAMARFNNLKIELVAISFVITVVCVAMVYRLRHKLDVLNLGKESAISLGIEYKKLITLLMIIVALLVSISTALTGPLMFFGLLITNLAYWLTNSNKHLPVLVTTILLSIICLIGGQLLHDQILNMRLPFVLLIELLGGVMFVVLLLRGIKS